MNEGKSGLGTSDERTPRATWARAALLVLIGVIIVVEVGAISGQGLTSSNGVTEQLLTGVSAPDGGTAGLTSALSTSTYTPLQLSIGAVPHAICEDDEPLCPAQEGESVVTLTAAAPNTGIATWPSVQVAFVIETTLYDGVYDPSVGDPGHDECAMKENVPCEESDGVPFFVAHAQQIANGIAAANPHSNVSFAMVDYFASQDAHDDGDGSEYHVDIPQFIPASAFGGQVQASFQATVLGGGYIYSDSDFSDNILHSSVITALFGTIIGSGLDWSPQTHHVIVWMGSTAPRDPAYVQDYAVSPSDDQSGTSATCEPSYSFGAVTEPECEGWVRSQDGNASHSIAGLAKTSPTCADSIGGVCTIDAIDLYATPTDWSSPGWPCSSALAQIGGCPNGRAVEENVVHVLEAGCDIAAATGGTWDGPEFFSCPSGQYGKLQPVFIGNPYNPDINNPTLFNAFREIGFGPVVGTQVANGTGHPIFQYIPINSIQLVPNQTIEAQCLLPSGQPFPSCDHLPTILNLTGKDHGLGWNWSTKASLNQMYLGDVWTVSFLVYATGPPLALVPVDACTTKLCLGEGSHALDGLYTWATYIPSSNNTIVSQSFPPAQVQVEGLPAVTPPGLPPPPPPPVPPPFAIPAPTAVPVLTAIGISAQVGVATVSLQAVAAGLLGAGFIRIATRNKPIANPVLAGKQKKAGSMFDPQVRSSGVGRFE